MHTDIQALKCIYIHEHKSWLSVEYIPENTPTHKHINVNIHKTLSF